MDNLRCSDCNYKEDFTPSGCEKCNTCEWGLGVSDLHTNFEPIDMKENINKVNDAIEVLKMFCCEQASCTNCPFGESCGDTPENWKPINADEVN